MYSSVTSNQKTSLGWTPGRQRWDCRAVRSGADLQDELHRPPLALLPIEYLTPAIEARAMTVQALLAERGLRRAPSVPDLLIAANAELTGATVLHADKDFDLIASVTGQPVQKVESFSG
jgi:predicted nucleic acid-binding protein